MSGAGNEQAGTRMTDSARDTGLHALVARIAAILGRGSVTVIDVGARWGAADAWWRLDPLARLIGFDADEVECARLAREAGSQMQRYVPVALGAVSGSATLHVTRDPASCSLYPPSRAVLDRYPWLGEWIGPIGTRQMQVSTLAAWAAKEGLKGFDFIKLDVQGAELDVLRGAGPLLDGCLGVEAEVFFNKLYEGQPLFAEVDTFLRKQGFSLWRLGSLAHYSELARDVETGTEVVHYHPLAREHGCGSGRLFWANAIFLRDVELFAGRPERVLVLACLLAACGDVDGAVYAIRTLADTPFGLHVAELEASLGAHA